MKILSPFEFLDLISKFILDPEETCEKLFESETFAPELRYSQSRKVTNNSSQASSQVKKEEEILDF
jgi:hypothetical protein